MIIFSGTYKWPRVLIRQMNHLSYEFSYSWPQMKVYRNSTIKRKRKRRQLSTSTFTIRTIHDQRTNINAERQGSQLSKQSQRRLILR